MVGVHVGDHSLRREYLLLGQPIQQATIATDFAKLGEVALSPEAHALLTRVCHMDKDVAKADGREAIVVAGTGEGGNGGDGGSAPVVAVVMPRW